MKKTKLLAFTLAAVVLLTGCGMKTLTCTRKSEADAKYEEILKIKYNKNDEVKRIEYTTIITNIGFYEDKEWLEMIKQIDGNDSPKEEKTKKGVKISSKIKKDRYQVTTKINVDKASKDTLKEFEYLGYDYKMDIEEFEEQLEDYNFKCN